MSIWCSGPIVPGPLAFDKRENIINAVLNVTYDGSLGYYIHQRHHQCRSETGSANELAKHTRVQSAYLVFAFRPGRTVVTFIYSGILLAVNVTRTEIAGKHRKLRRQSGNYSDTF